ncbi:MAG: carbohydrate ABC transporter permease, partial [Clostridiales bacterium]|nr:carbohydrate ABC transporter permease [Clostridiales bacterium]
MISDTVKSEEKLNKAQKAFKIGFHIANPVVVLVCVCAGLLSLFTAKEGGSARIISGTVFAVTLVAAIACAVVNKRFSQKGAYSQYAPAAIKKTNMRNVVPVIVFVLITLLPFYVLLLTSVKSAREANAPHFNWWAQEGLHFDNYKYVFDVMNGLRINPFIAFLNSMVYALVPSVIGTVISGLAAYGFAKLWFPGRDKLYRFMLFTIMIPGCVATSSSYLFFDTLGWVGQEGYSLPLLIPGCFGGMITIMFIKEYFMGIPDAVFEAARIDGAGRLQTFVRIALPLAIPAFTAQIIFGIITRYNDYLGPLIYCKYPEQYT